MSTNIDKIQSKLFQLEDFLSFRKALQASGKELVFTNGCFDVLHLGHVTYLAQAADLGDFLVVALNNDASVKAQNKGENRPINPENARAFLLASLSFVDAVVLFEDNTPLKLIQAIQPDVLVKGADYDAEETNPEAPKYIVGSSEVKAHGGKVKTIDLVPNYSSTAILKKQADLRKKT